MPCNSDYLNPTYREIELKRAAQLLVFVLGKVGLSVEQWMLDESNNEHAYRGESVTGLCAVLKSLNEEQINSIVYDAHDPQSRDLADWWEEHQREDAIREEKERQEAEAQRQLTAIVKKAYDRLSLEDKQALNILLNIK